MVSFAIVHFIQIPFFDIDLIIIPSLMASISAYPTQSVLSPLFDPNMYKKKKAILAIRQSRYTKIPQLSPSSSPQKIVI